MGQVVMGIIIAGLGFGVIYFTPHLLEIFGSNQRMENKLGSTRVGYVLFGFLVMVVGILMVFGLFDGPTQSLTSIDMSS